MTRNALTLRPDICSSPAPRSCRGWCALPGRVRRERRIMARMLRTIVSFFSGGKRNCAASNSRSRCSNRLTRSARAAGTAMVLRVRLAGVIIGGFQPFIADQKHRLAQIEGRKIGGGNGDGGFGQRHFLIVQSGPLTPEQDGGGKSFAAGGAQTPGRASGVRISRSTSRSRAVVANTSRMSARASAAFQRLRRRIDDVAGAGRQDLGAVIGPAALGRDQAQIREAEILHRPGGGADIFPHLGVAEDHGGGGHVRPLTGPRF